MRLSIDAAPLEQGPLGADGLNAEFSRRLDRAVDTILANGLAVQIDLHPEDSYKQPLRTSDDAVDRLIMLWRALAAHYATRDPERVFFEIMNEPEVNDPYRWAGIQARVGRGHSRSCAEEHHHRHRAQLLRPGGPARAAPLADGNVIYNFHFYDPHEFTHQGAFGARSGGATSTASLIQPRKQHDGADRKSFPTRSAATSWNTIGWTTGTRIAFAC